MRQATTDYKPAVWPRECPDRHYNIHPSVRPGDAVECDGITAVIDTLYYQDYDPVDGWDIEFVDTLGNYRHWKQYFDGGDVVYKTAGPK